MRRKNDFVMALMMEFGFHAESFGVTADRAEIPDGQQDIARDDGIVL